tara:strand:- start:1275 stop:1502 length:228 start_codon:yes stop_codon:yes gene_type:complete
MSEEQKIKSMLLLELGMLDELESDIQKIMNRLRLHKHFVKTVLDLKKVVKTDGGLYLFEEEGETKVLTFPTKEKN